MHLLSLVKTTGVSQHAATVPGTTRHREPGPLLSSRQHQLHAPHVNIWHAVNSRETEGSDCCSAEPVKYTCAGQDKITNASQPTHGQGVRAVGYCKPCHFHEAARDQRCPAVVAEA